jgi:2-C-methyl-D-erythritol 4-phosphate cytidylyltransferase / 2-C-methyl-D-erythritol 2,4-cyclodiphosphate synthase
MQNATDPAASSFAAIVLAAGRGERVGAGEGPKQYRMLGDRTVLRRTLDVFARHPRIGRIVVAIHPDDEPLLAASIGGLPVPVVAVHGGATRQASTLRALKAFDAGSTAGVLIHDAARPFLDAAMIDRVIDAVAPGVGAIPALAVSDTLKKTGDDGAVIETIDRAGLFAAQTPQGFPFAEIVDAHERAAASGRSDFTDDASIAEWAGLAVRLVEGSPDNVKITWSRDIEMAKERMTGARAFPDIRTGNGYDVHSFAEGSAVWLCGVEIAHTHRLNGHSDADVGLHALTDALLATCGEGDIGTHFPPSDEQWRGAASRIFIAEAVRIVRARGGRISNADVTLIAETPKIGPHRDAMRAAMAEMLGVTLDRVSVKATTNERLGFVGREEGIAAIATATVIYPGEVPE